MLIAFLSHIFSSKYNIWKFRIWLSYRMSLPYFSSDEFSNCISNPLTVNRIADSRLTRSHFFHFNSLGKPQVDLQRSTILQYSDAISIFCKQWKPSVRPLSTISIRIYLTKGETDARRAGRDGDTRWWNVSSGKHRRESLSLLSSHLHCFHYESGNEDYLTEEIHPSEKKRASPAWKADRSINGIKLRVAIWESLCKCKILGAVVPANDHGSFLISVIMTDLFDQFRLFLSEN